MEKGMCKWRCDSTIALVYLLVIEVIVCTQPDHHAEVESLIRCVICGIFPMHMMVRGADQFHLH